MNPYFRNINIVDRLNADKMQVYFQYRDFEIHIQERLYDRLIDKEQADLELKNKQIELGLTDIEDQLSKIEDICDHTYHDNSSALIRSYLPNYQKSFCQVCIKYI